MNLTLAIETSSIDYGVALCTPHAVIVDRTVRRDDPSFRGVGHLVSVALDAAGGQIRDIDRIAVNVGPGNLSSVRAGVAYANGLAFSLRIRIFGANSLDLLALEASEPTDPSVLCLRHAGGSNVYAGLFRDGTAVAMRRGPIKAVVTSMAWGLTDVAVAGSFRREVKGLLPETVVRDTGIEVPHVLTLHRFVVAAGGDPAAVVDVASPLTDASPVFQQVDEK
jgi:tRNA threonylcarbamoyladenosine biosynthesis protein TsaB